MNERIAAITTIFSDCSQIKIMRHLSGSDAQAFIDMMDEVSPFYESKQTNFDLNSFICQLGAGRPPASAP